MIEMMFDKTLLGKYSRTKSKDVYFRTFKSVGNNVFGTGSQSVTNAGTSMLTNTVGTVPDILELYNSYIKIDSLAIQYSKDVFDFENNVKLAKLDEFITKTDKFPVSDFIITELPSILNENIYIDIRKNYIRYKNNKSYRKKVNECIFSEMETLTFNKNIPIAFIFILYAINTFKKNNFMSNSKHKEYKIASEHYSSQSELIEKYSEILQISDDVIDLTDCCTGQYRFVDYHLSATTDVKALPLVLVHLLIDNSSFLEKFLIGRSNKVKLNKKKK